MSIERILPHHETYALEWESRGRTPAGSIAIVEVKKYLSQSDSPAKLSVIATYIKKPARIIGKFLSGNDETIRVEFSRNSDGQITSSGQQANGEFCIDTCLDVAQCILLEQWYGQFPSGKIIIDSSSGHTKISRVK